MEYIKINDKKLKISLVREDLLAWDISADELDYANPLARSVLDGIFASAKDKFGFDTSGHRVLLRLFTSRDGGCEIFVTLLDESECEELPRDTERSSKDKTLAYSFERLSHLCGACRRIAVSIACKESSAYFDAAGRWFLTLCTDEDLSSTKQFDRLSFMSEYGEREDPSSLELYLCEHATPISEKNAVALLSTL